MDKETLSNYGWIVILVLVLAVMLALATPFGTFIAGAIKSTTAGLFDVNQAALGSAGIDVNDMVFENCDHLETELRNVTDTYTGDTCCKACGAVMSAGQTVRPKVSEGATYTAADGTVYGPGEEMPEVVTTGDGYTYGGYDYRYNQYSNGNMSWTTDETQNGWGVDTTLNNQVSYGEIMSTINGQPVTNMAYTFNNCYSMSTPPQIPNTVTNMNRTFQGCNITTAPDISACTKLTTMNGTFYGCKKLTNLGEYVIPDSVRNVESLFVDCKELTDSPVLPEGITSLNSTFTRCLKLVNVPTLPSTVTDMTHTFNNCTSLEVAPEIPSSVTWMYMTFLECSSLKEAPVIPSSVKNMSGTFMRCTSLADVSNIVIPKGVTNMLQSFYGCTSLTTTPEIPDTVTSMYQAFSYCTSLTSKPVIPSSVTTAESDILSGCTQFGY